MSKFSQYISVHRRSVILSMMVAAMLVLSAVPAFAQEEPPTIDIPLGTLFDSINNWVEVFLPILAIGGGIMIAIALLNLVINTIRRALGGSGR